MFGLFIGATIWVAEVVVGTGLVINCARGLYSGEGMYDAASSTWMRSVGWLGIGAGLVLLADAIGLINIPLWNWLLPFGGVSGGG